MDRGSVYYKQEQWVLALLPLVTSVLSQIVVDDEGVSFAVRGLV